MPEPLSALKRGEAAAFDAVYARHRPGLYAFLLRMTGRREVAEDLLQETWLRLARSAPGLADDTELGAWLFTVARNLCRSHRRWQVLDLSRIGQLLRTPKASPPSPLEQLAATDAERALERALAALSAGDRELLLLVGAEGLTPTQAASVLGLRPDAARQRLLRARARLAEQLGDAAPDLSRKASGGAP